MKNDTTQSGHSFTAYFKRATSPLVVLRLLAEKPMYGYELSQTMKRRSGGLFTISVLYPVIYRLQEQGFVEEERCEVVDNRNRSYYAVTPAGRAYLEKTWAEYLEISRVFDQMMRE